MELSVQDINTLIEAVDAWETASKTSSMLSGLLLGALHAREGNANDGKTAFKSMMEGEEETEKSRREQGIILKAKLLALRDRIEAQELAKFAQGG